MNRGDLILSRRVPEGIKTKQIALVEYEGYSALMPVEYLYNDRYKLEFIKQTGVTLPSDFIVPVNVPHMFCHNICDIKGIKYET